MQSQTAQKYSKLISLAVFILLFSELSFAQLSVYPASLGFRYNYGFIIQHKQDMDQLVSGHVPAYELYYRYNFSGLKEWEKFFNYPHAGAALQVLDFNNSKLGSAWSLIPYMSFPLRKSRIAELHLRSGFGLAYNTQVFDLDENRKNGVISTRINAAIQFSLQAHWRIIPEAELLTGISFTHYSNGAFKEPNAGINLASATIGLNVNFGRPVKVNHNSFPIVDKRWRYLVTIAGFAKEIKPVEGPKYAAISLSGNALKRFSPKSSWGGAFDIMYDASLTERARIGMRELRTPLRSGLALCYELHVGKISIPIQQGIYYLNPIKVDGILYQRLGVRYHVNKKWQAQCLLKTHMASADYIELGIGYFIK